MHEAPHHMPNEIMTVEAVFHTYSQVTANASFDNNPIVKNDFGLRSVWANLLNRNMENFLACQNAISLFNLIMSDRRITRIAQQELVSRVYMAMAYSSDNKTFTGLPYPVKVEARSLKRGTVFVWCDVLHVHAGNGLAAEVDDNLSRAHLLFNFSEQDDEKAPFILHIGDVDADTIANIDED